MLTDDHRGSRHTAIVRLLRATPVRRQQELVRLLKREGYAVTQSSVSRDLRELGVLKASDGYILPSETTVSGPAAAGQYSSLARFIRDVRPAGASIMVVKCQIGTAQSVALAIDKSEWPEVVGTVSGDDTLFIATEDARAQTRLRDRLRRTFGV
jgi:transcriptional regulator of arginine metabolism